MVALSYPHTSLMFALLKGLLATLAALLTYRALLHRRAHLPRRPPKGAMPAGSPEQFPAEPIAAVPPPRDPATSQPDDGDDWHGRTPEIRQRRRDAAAVARQLHHVRAMRSN